MGKYMNRRIGVLIFCCWLGAAVGAVQCQPLGDPEAELKKYRLQYPDEQAIFLDYRDEMHVFIANDTVRAKVVHSEEVMHLGENSKLYAQGNVYSSSFNLVSELVAQTFLPDKKKYRSVDVEEFRESFDTDSYVFYDDSRHITFVFPSVQPGARTRLSYLNTIKDSRFLGGFRFGSYLPMINSSFTVVVDEGIDIDFLIFNASKEQIRRTEVKKNGQVIYSFTVQNIPKIKFESDAPPLSYTKPQVVPVVKSFTNEENETINVLNSLEDLHLWYTGFVKGLKEEDEAMKQILADLLLPEDTELERVKKIFYWVQDNIKYIAFEQGMRGLIPHSAAYILNKRYGDCKDMSSIVINLMHNAGIEGHFTWIGSRDIPFKYSDLPSPLVDNHMIATYLAGDSCYFLDATGLYTPMGFPTSMIQGKEALISLGDRKFEVLTVPVVSAEKSAMMDKYSYRIENGGIYGSGQLSITGYAKVANTSKMVKSDNKSVDDYVNRLLSRGNNKFFVDHYTIENLHDRDKPIQVAYDFRVQDYYRTTGNDIYFNMNLDKGLAGAYIKDDRVHAITNDYKYVNISQSTLLIPEGYEVKSLPGDAKLETEVFSYTITFRQEADKIIQERSYTVNYLQLEPGQFETYNNALRSFSDAIRQVVVLSKTES